MSVLPLTPVTTSDQSIDDQAALLCFRAAVEGEYVEIVIDDPATASYDSLRGTLELAKYESLIQSIEDWLGHGLDFEVSDKRLTTSPLFSWFGNDAPVTVQLGVPAGLWVPRIGQLPQFSDGNEKIEWQAYYSRVHLGELSLSTEDMERLKPGSVVLIPGSFDDKWNVNLHVPALRYCQSGLFVKDPFYWQGMLEFPVQGAGTSQVLSLSRSDTIGCYFELPTDQLLRSGNDLNLLVNEKITQTLCVLNTVGDRRFTGHLIPVGSGFGLRLEHTL